MKETPHEVPADRAGPDRVRPLRQAVALGAAAVAAVIWCAFAWSEYSDGLGHQYNAYAIAGPAPQPLSPDQIAQLTHIAKYETRLGGSVEPLEWERRWDSLTGGLLPPLYARPLTQDACEHELVRDHADTPLLLRKTCHLARSWPGLLSFMLLPAALLLAGAFLIGLLLRQPRQD